MCQTIPQLLYRSRMLTQIDDNLSVKSHVACSAFKAHSCENICRSLGEMTPPQFCLLIFVTITACF